MATGQKVVRCESIRYGAIDMDGHRAVDRPPMNQAQFDKEYGDTFEQQKTTFKGSAKKAAKQLCYPCTGVRPLMETIVGFMPILSWLPNYNIKENLVGDIVGGLTTGIMHVPQGIAYSLLAGVDPVNGLYASCFPAFFYMFFGTSRHVSIGSFAVVALMAGVANDNVQISLGYNGVSHNGTMPVLQGVITPSEIAATLTFALGMIQFLCGVLRLQFLTAYFSDQLVSGFTTGAAVHVLVSQLDDVIGVKVPKVSGPGYIFVRLYDLAVRIPDANMVAIITSIVAIVFLYCGKEHLSPYLKNKFKLNLQIPYELIIVAISAAVYAIFGLSEKYEVPIVAEIPTGMPHPQWPVWSILPNCIVNAAGIAVVTIAIHISMAKMLAKKMNYTIDPQQELYALGLTAMYGGFFPVYPISTALGRTMVNVSSGSKTLFSTVFSCSLLMIIILWLGPLLRTLPMCILASIILVALKGMFQKYDELRKLYPVSKIDFLIWMVSFFTTVCIDVMQGLALSIAFALFTLICRSQWPRWQRLIRLADPSESDDKDSQSPADICVYRFDAPLMFANVERFRKTIRKSLDEWDMRTKAKEQSLLSSDQESETSSEFMEKTVEAQCEGKFRHPRFFIMDCSLVMYADYMGLGALKEIAKEIRTTGISVYLCGAKTDVRSSMLKAKVLEEIPVENIFPTLKDALAIAYRNGEAAEILCSGKKEQLKWEISNASQQAAASANDLV